MKAVEKKEKQWVWGSKEKSNAHKLLLPLNIDLHLFPCRTSTVRPCCCWLCPPCRSVWTWSSAPPSSCVTRSSASRSPFTDSLPTDLGAAPKHPRERKQTWWSCKLGMLDYRCLLVENSGSSGGFPAWKKNGYFFGAVEKKLSYKQVKTRINSWDIVAVKMWWSTHKKCPRCRLRRHQTHGSRSMCSTDLWRRYFEKLRTRFWRRFVFISCFSLPFYLW